MEQMYRQCFGHPAVVSISYWGLSDRRIWIEGGGLIDEAYRPKTVFEMLRKLIKGEWMTKPFMGQTNENGEIDFCGFHGKYELVLPRSNRQHRSLEFNLAANKANIAEFIL